MSASRVRVDMLHLHHVGGEQGVTDGGFWHAGTNSRGSSCPTRAILRTGSPHRRATSDSVVRQPNTCTMPKAITSSSSKTVQFVKSLYNDPFRWSLVKSVALFAVAIYVAKEMSAAEHAAAPS